MRAQSCRRDTDPNSPNSPTLNTIASVNENRLQPSCCLYILIGRATALSRLTRNAHRTQHIKHHPHTRPIAHGSRTCAGEGVGPSLHHPPTQIEHSEERRRPCTRITAQAKSVSPVSYALKRTSARVPPSPLPPAPIGRSWHGGHEIQQIAPAARLLGVAVDRLTGLVAHPRAFELSKTPERRRAGRRGRRSADGSACRSS